MKNYELSLIREVLSITSAYHGGDVCAKTLRYMGIEVFCKGDETVIRKRPSKKPEDKGKEVDTPIKVAVCYIPEIAQMLKEMHITLLETSYEEGSIEEINDLLGLAKGTDVNPYAKWRIVDLVTPKLQKYYPKKYDEAGYTEQCAPYSMQEYFNEATLIVFKVIDEFKEAFLGLLNLRLLAVAPGLNDFYNNVQKITVWKYINEVDEYINKVQMETGKTPNVDEIAKALGYTDSRVEVYLSLIFREIVGSDVFSSASSDSQEGALFQSELYKSGFYTESAEAAGEREMNAGLIREVVDSLDLEVEREVIKAKFDLEGCLTMMEVRKKYHIKKDDVEPIYYKAIEVLSEKLKDFVTCEL